MTELQETVARLDGLLTGKVQEALRNAKQRDYMFADITTFIAEVSSDAYYLADGGYSRLMIDYDGVVRGLSQVSLAAVKARWADPAVQAMVARLQTLLNEKGPD